MEKLIRDNGRAELVGFANAMRVYAVPSPLLPLLLVPWRGGISAKTWFFEHAVAAAAASAPAHSAVPSFSA